jgi:hypothetical protein
MGGLHLMPLDRVSAWACERILLGALLERIFYVEDCGCSRLICEIWKLF